MDISNFTKRKDTKEGKEGSKSNNGEKEIDIVREEKERFLKSVLITNTKIIEEDKENLIKKEQEEVGDIKIQDLLIIDSEREKENKVTKLNCKKSVTIKDQEEICLFLKNAPPAATKRSGSTSRSGPNTNSNPKCPLSSYNYNYNEEDVVSLCKCLIPGKLWKMWKELGASKKEASKSSSSDSSLSSSSSSSPQLKDIRVININ